MHESSCGVLSLVALAGLMLPALSQTSGVQTSDSGAGPHKPQPQHYTATLKTTLVRTLADGTTITMESTMVLAEDSQGRSISSHTDLWHGKDGKPTTYYTVLDPVEGTFLTWTSPGTQAIVTTNRTEHTGESDCTVFFSTPEGYSLIAPQGDETLEPAKRVVGKFSSVLMKTDSPADFMRNISDNLKTEDLGITTIQGVRARGRRFTRTTPAGAMGNDQPMVHTQEDWFTTGDNPRELNIRHVDEDPESGKSTTELESLSLEEPDLSIFQPPEGYEIVKRETHSAQCPKELKPLPH